MSKPVTLRRLVTAFIATLALASSLVIATVAAPSGADVTDGWDVIDVGYQHTCGLTTLGEAYCWGSTAEGALGNGVSGGPGRERLPVPVITPPGVTWATIDVGQYHTCALTTDGDLYCWGNDNLDVGTLGNGPVVDGQFRYDEPTPVVTPAGVTWASISTGVHSCALTTDGDAYCWGRGLRGQIGDGANLDRDVPTLVSAPPGVTWASIHAGPSNANNFGSRTTCAITTDGAGYCWGADTYGQLGNDTALDDSNVPVEVVTPAGETWTSLRPGMNHSCGVTNTGDGYCWGRGESGRLGTGDLLAGEFPEPLAVATPTDVDGWTDIVPGGFYTCGVTTDADLYCWGAEGQNGYLGNGEQTVAPIEPAPLPVSTPPEVAGWRSVATGNQHTCAVDVDDVGWCWGRDTYGMLGDGGTDTQFDVPTMVRATEPVGGPQSIEQFFLAATYEFGEAPFRIRATVGSGLEVVFTSNTPGVCTVGDEFQQDGFTNAVVTLVGLGQCSITATQPGDDDWDAATPVTLSASVTAIAAQITLSGLSQTYDGTPKPVTVTTDPPGLGYVVTYDGSATAPTDAGSYAVVATVNEAGHASTQALGTLVVGTAPQTIAFDAPGDISFGDPDVPIAATATSGLPVEFSVAGPCTTDGTTVTATNAGQCSVTASQDGDDNWAAATPVVHTFTIAGAASTISVSGWDATYDGSSHAVGVTTDPVGLATSTTYDGSPTPPTDAGSYAVVVTVTETGYDPEQVTGTLTIAKAPQAITVEPFRLQVFGDGGIDLVATATSGLPVTFAAAGVCTMTGNHVNQTGAGNCFVTMSQAGDDNWLAAADVVENAEITPASSTTTLVAPGADTAVGTEATFTATVSGVVTPAGSVTFTADTGASEIVSLVDGVATWRVADLPLGTSSVTAEFGGDVNHYSSTSDPASHTVVSAPLGITGLPDEVEVDDPVDVTATGFEPGEDVDFVFESDPIDVGRTTADPTGTATLSFTIPDAGAGAHTLRATGVDSGLETSAATAIVEATPPTTDTTTPTTQDPTVTSVPTTPANTATPLAQTATGATTPTASGFRASGDLAQTGTESTSPLAAIGAALLLAGIVLAGGSRRRLG